MWRRQLDEPTMSDGTLLVSVEDLINRAMGPGSSNVVHFKLVQTILHIMARQMRLLEQLVEVRMSDLEYTKEDKGERDVSPTKDKYRKLSPTKGKLKRSKDKDKADVNAEKDIGKMEKDRDREKEKTEKAAAKAAKDEEKNERAKSVVGSQTGISVKERGSGIAVVTRSEFEVVEATVRALQRRGAPPPPPAMPTNSQLRSDIARGSASLTDTMEHMQLAARVGAAERAVGHMAELLTALAASGALPADVARRLHDAALSTVVGEDGQLGVKRTTSVGGISHKSVAMDPKLPEDAGAGRAAPLGSVAASQASLRTSLASKLSIAGMPGVTHPEMDVAMQALREDLLKEAQVMTNKANAVAENAGRAARGVSDRLNVATELNSRISALTTMVTDYADQLSGMDTGLTSQMTSFRDQMTQIREELQAGLTQLALVNNNAETAAVLELSERHELLVVQLERTLHAHGGLTACQQHLALELQSLVECVEMLREQKADRDEVLDGLRDKADNSRLAGLLTAEEFAKARAELEGRLALCHDKFHRQENVWMTALKDLLAVTEEKAEVTQLLAARDSAEEKLRELHDTQQRLAVLLGEPQAALIMRALCKDAYCGACLAPALMQPSDPAYGAPPPLAALRAPAPPCAPRPPLPAPPDHREHICNRWVGGSHTLLSGAVTRERARPPLVAPRPTKQYVDKGDDGRLYMMEEDLQPCVECNQFVEPDKCGAGDQKITKAVDDMP